MILCNGQPKTGTHLLVKTVRLFEGCKTKAIHSHYNADRVIPDDLRKRVKHIEIIRNPRNVLMSWARFTDGFWKRENIFKYIPNILDNYHKHLIYIEDPDVLTVKFEKLLTDPTELDKIAEFIDRPLIEDHFKKLWGDTYTFTGTKEKPVNLSNWKDYWPKPIEQDYEGWDSRWDKYGGYDLEERLGYDPYETFVRKTDG